MMSLSCGSMAINFSAFSIAHGASCNCWQASTSARYTPAFRGASGNRAMYAFRLRTSATRSLPALSMACCNSNSGSPCGFDGDGLCFNGGGGDCGAALACGPAHSAPSGNSTQTHTTTAALNLITFILPRRASADDRQNHAGGMLRVVQNRVRGSYPFRTVPGILCRI